MDRQTLRDWVHRYNAEGSPGSRTAGAKRDRGGSTRAMWPNLCHGWRPAPTRWWTGWCAGGGRTFAPGSRTGSRSSCTSARSASISLRSATGGCRCARGIRRPTLRPRNALKKFPRGCSRRAPRGGLRQAAGDLVPGRGQGRPAGHAHPGLGEAGHAATRAARSSLPVGLFLRCDLPRTRRHGDSRHALRRQRRHERPSCRHRHAVASGALAVLVLDNAGWHTSHALVVPDNISLVLLPPYSPELNPVENVWQFFRANWLASLSVATMTPSSMHAAKPGTASPRCPRSSPPSPHANGKRHPIGPV